MNISLVIPIFNEAPCLPELCSRLQKTLYPLWLDYEVIFVDDASSDESWEIIKNECKNNHRFKAIRLRNRSGHQRAVFTAFHKTTGDAVMTLDGDLQHPPEKIPDFLEAWKNSGSELVYGFKTAQEGRSPFKKILNRLFHRILSFRLSRSMHPETSDFQIMGRGLAERVKKTWDPAVFLRAWIHYQAKSTSRIPFEAAARFKGETKQKISWLLKLGVGTLFFFPNSTAQNLRPQALDISETLGFEPGVEKKHPLNAASLS